MPSSGSRELVERILGERGIRAVDLPEPAKPYAETKPEQPLNGYRTMLEIGPEWHDQPYNNADCWIEPTGPQRPPGYKGPLDPMSRVEGKVTPRPGQTEGAARMAAHRVDPEVRRREKYGNKARDTAFRRLAAIHADEYVTLLNEERANLGLHPIKTRGKYRTKTESRIIRGTKFTHADEQKTTRPPSHNSPNNPKNQPPTPGVPGQCGHEPHKLVKLSYGTVCHPKRGGCGGRVG